MKTILLLATACVFTANYSAAEDVTKPLAYLSGNNSKVAKPSYERISSADEWAKVWAQHQGASKDGLRPSLFEVDFDRYMILAILRGKQNQVEQIEVNSISDQKDFLVVRFTEYSYAFGEGAPESEFTCPYAFVVLPKSDKEIVLMQGHPPKARRPTTNWEEITRVRADGTKRQPVKVKSDSGN